MPARPVSPRNARRVTFAINDSDRVSGLVLSPPRALACCVLAHGAGAGMTHPFMQSLAAEMARHRIATFRFQFLSMERGLKRPDTPPVAHAVVRKAVAEAGRHFPKLPLFAGGKSFGGRMTSQAQADEPLPGVRGLICIGFPLHPPDKPSSERAEHLAAIRIPLLFLQGTRDKLAELRRLKAVCRHLGGRITLRLLKDADHSFHVPVRSGRNDAAVLREAVGAMADWIQERI